VAEVAKLSQTDPLELIFGDSVDFQLIFTIPETAGPQLQGMLQAHDLSFVEIGRATQGSEVLLRRSNGDMEQLPGVAWRHAV
jgi:thiamine-monophosphate kinase